MQFEGLVAFLIAALVIAATRQLFRRRSRAGPGAMGTMDGMLNEDKRKAVQIIVEERAEERRPEYPDGNLPDLEDPRKQRSTTREKP
jgi:hypothetical protein